MRSHVGNLILALLTTGAIFTASPSAAEFFLIASVGGYLIGWTKGRANGGTKS